MKQKLYVITSVLLLTIVVLFAYNREVRNVIFPKTERIVTLETEENRQSLKKLTSESVVIPFVKAHRKLPDYYITKDEAIKRGWRSSKTDLCKVARGKAIGGDVFDNTEYKLPSCSGRVWYTADLNYSCGYRNAHRLLYSNDGLIYISYNHYKTFIQK